MTASRIKLFFLISITSVILSGCSFLRNSLTYKDKTKKLVSAILNEDYSNAIGHFAMDHEMAQSINLDTMKIGLQNFRQLIVSNWGIELEYKFIRSEKTFSTVESERTPPNTTNAFIEFSNKEEFGVFRVLFDDSSGKIISINTQDIKASIPSMSNFWLFGLFALCIPAFNIYTIIRIKRSNLKKKWQKYLGVILLNVPSLTFSAVYGFSWSLLSFQFLLGVSFSHMGYLGSVWTIGLPLGGIYWYRKTMKKNQIDQDTQGHSNLINEVLDTDEV